LVARVLAVAPDAVVVLNTGAPVALPWLAEARALLQCWFGGQEMGEAVVDVLLGDAEPGGRLPTTFPLRVEDTPSFGNFPAEHGRTIYGERTLIGHRWYEARGLPVAFPFGHGLSYTTFEIGAPSVTAAGGVVTVQVEVTNTGDRAGAEVVQLYVGASSAMATRPPQTLAAFRKVVLGPGESTTVEMTLDRRAFARWQRADTGLAEAVRLVAERASWANTLRVPEHSGWVVDDGEHQLRIGRSSADIAHTVMVAVAAGPA